MSRRNVMRRRGVAVWEVVVVLGLIAVLSAVLAPSFAAYSPFENARESARKSQCQNNIKEVAIALQVYWNDYDATLPSSKLVNNSKKWNKTDFLMFGTMMGKLPPAPGKKRLTYSAIMYDHMKNKDIMFCPSDPARISPGAVSEVSYWWKTAVDKAWYGDGYAPCRKEGDFGYNSDQIVFYEHLGWHSGDLSGLKNGVQINVAYMDSHVKCITLRNATSGNPIDCAANADGEPMYFNWDMDTGTNLPSQGPAKFTNPRRYADKL